MKIECSRVVLLVLACCAVCLGQGLNSQKKHLLVLGEEKGYRHESVSHALATIEHLGEESTASRPRVARIRPVAATSTPFSSSPGANSRRIRNRKRICCRSSTTTEKGLSEYTAPLSRLQRGRSMEK